ncbi:endonuclease VII domain-containing protein [Streptomyces sp. NBC_01353]|uniref:endonuclease VII domain-containing protein n=1 Tax=Streptomyces sp. NBC_01353 TaxID=2903835 RepID=UPI003DA5D62F
MHYQAARKRGELPPAEAGAPARPTHRLSNVNREARTADCSLCGPGAAVRIRDDKRRPAECKRNHIRRKRDREFKQEYGISREEFRRRVAEQQGLCQICRIQPTFLCVDHDHRTGMVRGLLCTQCNFALGHLRDSPALALAAAEYLRLHGGGTAGAYVTSRQGRT